MVSPKEKNQRNREFDLMESVNWYNRSFERERTKDTELYYYSQQRFNYDSLLDTSVYEFLSRLVFVKRRGEWFACHEFGDGIGTPVVEIIGAVLSLCLLPGYRGEGGGERKWSRSLKLSSGGENWRKIPLVLVPKSTPEFRRFNSWHLSPHVLSVLSTQLSFSPLRKRNKTRGCWTLESKRLSRLIKISSSSSLDQSLILRRWYMHRHNVVINHVINVLCN